MGISEALAGLTGLFGNASVLLALLLAVPFGMIAGAIPGLGGKLSIVISLPFLFGVDPVAGAVFLIAMHSVVHTGGPIPSILIGVPGSAPDAATVLDGHPMARNGEAGRALGAALMSSCIGGLIGAACLIVAIPFVRPLVSAFGPPEVFLMSVLGISLIASVSGDALRKGLTVGCFGLLVSFVGMDPFTATARYTFGQIYLWDGIDLITAVIGIFAIPEVLSLLKSASHDDTVPYKKKENSSVRQGMLDVWHHRYLTLRASLIGSLIGIVPGLGGQVASWFAYGHAVQTSKNPEQFGTGRVEGVIAPESANNSKEGGSLLPTLFFGIPGSSGMAILLAALLTLGIAPGASMANEKLPLVWTFIWALVLANLLSVIVFLAGSKWILKFMDVPSNRVFPFVLTFALLGCYLSALYWQTFVLLMAFGLLGIWFKRHEWPRAPFAIGVVLGTATETALNQSLTIWGWSFLLRPASLVLLAIVAASFGYSFYRAWKGGFNAAKSPLWLAGLMAALFAGSLYGATSYPAQAAFFPIGVAAVGLALALLDFVVSIRAHSTAQAKQPGTSKPALHWLLAFVLAAILFGLSPGLPIMVAIYLYRQTKSGMFSSLMAGAMIYVLFEVVLSQYLGMNIFHGLMLSYVDA